MTDDIIEADTADASVDVLAKRTTAPAHHPSTVVLAAATLERIGVKTGELVRLATAAETAYAVAETDDATGLEVGADELLADVPVFNELFCAPRQRVTVSRATLPAANHFTVTPVDPTTAPVLERCSVSTAGLVDAVAHEHGIVAFRPDEVCPDDPPGPYYASVTDVCPEAPARVTADTYVDVAEHAAPSRSRGVLTPEERRDLQQTDLTDAPTDDDVRALLRDRLAASLQDFQLLARHLPDDDLERVFGGDDGPSRAVSAATDTMALCWLGLDHANQRPTWRVEQAIERATYAQDEDAEVSLRVTRQPAPPATAALDRLRRLDSETLGPDTPLERLWASPEVDPYELYTVTRDAFGEDIAIPPAALIIERLAYRGTARRFPDGQILDVSIGEEQGEER